MVEKKSYIRYYEAGYMYVISTLDENILLGMMSFNDKAFRPMGKRELTLNERKEIDELKEVIKQKKGR